MSCLDENKVVEFIQGLLSREAAAQIEAHLDECPSCRQLMAEVAKLSIAGGSSRGSRPPPEEEDPGTASVRTGSGHSELDPGHVLAGRFRILRRLGRGSFGAVYEAEDLQLEEHVALKLLRAEVRQNPSFLGHLHHEIVVGRRISHPNVCRIYDLGTCGEIHFISMALVRGEGLDRYLERGLPTPEQALSILLQIAQALEAAHHQGVVHRDLKPSNIMVQPSSSPDAEPVVIVMDFGLARDLRAGPSLSGVLIGSPAYWSPEQARGDRATERSDLYSFGLLACDLFGVKHPPFGGAPDLGQVPPTLRSVLERCLRALPTERYASAAEVHAALGHASHAARGRIKRLRYVLRFALAAAAGAGAVLLAVFLRTPAPPGAGSGSALTGSGRGSTAGPAAGTGSVAVQPLRADAGHASDLGRRVAVVRPPPPKKRVPLKVALRPPAAERSPDAGRPAPPVPSLAPLLERFARLEVERKRRGFLLDDLPGGRATLAELRRAASSSDEPATRAALGKLEGTLRALKIDGTFVSRKLERLTRAKGGVKLDEATEKKVTGILRQVHDCFFSGDYEGANGQLNAIWRALGKGD